MDVKNVIDGYISQKDWRTKENANTGFSFSGLSLRLTEDAVEEYILDHLLPKEVSIAHKTCYIKIQDCGFLSGYCIGHDLRKLIKDGLNGVPGKINTAPPKHLSSLINIMVNFLGISQMEFAGAQAFSNFDTLIAPFIKADNLTYEQTKQNIQNFIFHMNIPNRWGLQNPFSNITIDIKCPEMFEDKPAIVGGKKQPFTYKDCQKEMDMVNQAMFEVFSDGDAAGAPFTFPIVTINLTKDFDWESQISKLIFRTTSKYGLPYFQNFCNGDLTPEDVYSMCCRLRLDKRELIKKTGGIFGAGVSTGSLRVITLNLPKIAYEANGSVGKFYEGIKKYCLLAKDAHEIFRKTLNGLTDMGLYPYFKRYYGSFDTFFSTIGVVGGNEACLNLVKKDILSTEGKWFMVNTLKYIRELIADFQEQTGNLYNLEATPAESTAYKLAIYDKKQYPDIITSGTPDAPYYTNSTHYPVGSDLDFISAIEHQQELQNLYTSGTVLHFFLGEDIKNWRTCANLVKRIATNSTLPYFSITPSFSVCPVCGYLSGVHHYCPNNHKQQTRGDNNE